MKYKIVLLLVLGTAVFFRFFQLGTNPPSLTWDEVALGYNAYSLGIDGKDEFGQFLPTAYLESFGDYKPPLYAYLDILPIKIFGLTEFAVRFPSAFFGSLTVLVAYFLIKRIFNTSKQKDLYALAGAGVLAFSPWHIMLSRAAFEANIATFFLIVGVWAFLASVQNRKWLLLLSALSFVLSLYTFNTARIVAPLLLCVFALVFYKDLLKIKKQTILAAIMGIVLVLPLIPFMLSPQAKVRFQEVNIFTDPKLIENRNQQVLNDNNSILSHVLHNHRVIYAQAFFKHYFDHFNPSFLFVKGDINPKFSIQDTGQLYLIELPFLLIGLFVLFRKREGHWWIIPIWLLIAIIPAGTARETPHALRTEAVLPTFQVLVGYGAVCAALFLERSARTVVIKRLVYAFAAIFFLVSVFYFQYEYYTHYPIRFSADWQYGYRESIEYVAQHKSEYDRVYDMGGMGRPYIYYLFYTKIDPREFRVKAVVERDVFGFVNVSSFDKYVFPKEAVSPGESKKNLYIISGGSIPEGSKKLKEIKRVDGVTALTIYTD